MHARLCMHACNVICKQDCVHDVNNCSTAYLFQKIKGEFHLHKFSILCLGLRSYQHQGLMLTPRYVSLMLPFFHIPPLVMLVSLSLGHMDYLHLQNSKTRWMSVF